MINKIQRTRFIADAISEKLEAKKRELHEAYVSMNQDPGQVEAMKDWENTLADGIND